MKVKLVTVGIILGVFGAVVLNADDTNTDVKQAIKANGQLVYSKTQKQVDSLSEMFQEGAFYGRLRNNNFFFAYDVQDSTNDTHLIPAVGASLVYKSAKFSGFDFSLGLYGSQVFFDDNRDPVSKIKPGKDTFSRYDYIRTGSTSMGVVGQANLKYSVVKGTDIILGRQLFESFYTKSNDTKMIPNSFDGITAKIKSLPNHTIKLAYLAKQKLRDHTTNHSVLMYDDRDTSAEVQTNWNANDDAGMHKGLSYTNLVAQGKSTDAPLMIAEVKNSSIKNLRVDISSYFVPELLSQAMGELNYKIKVGGLNIAPGIRYIQQFDNGAGAVGGASLSGDSTGYKNTASLDAQMIAARIVTKIDEYKINLGYTNILNKADLVTPWRGFPTAGYTRSMGIYNWKANTKSYRLEVIKSANKTGVYKNMFIQASVLYIDGDIKKSSTADSMFYYAGFIKNLDSMPEFQYRVRLGYRDFVGDSSNVSDYLDSRLEFNYLF
ncbi:MAG: hypothetical protein ABFQ64_03135 [Campylobacterota bacterium]